MAKVSPGEFGRQVKQEVTKVTWPGKRETLVTGVMVFIMVFIMAMFFLGVDFVIRQLMEFILGLGA